MNGSRFRFNFFRNLGNKSQIFIFDLIFASIMIFVSISLFFAYYSTTTDNSNLYSLNYEILNSFTKTGINSLNDESIRKMFKNGQIRNKDNTVAQQVSEYYYLGQYDLARNLTTIFVNNYLTKRMNFNITLSNESSNFVLYQGLNTEVFFENSTVSTQSNRIILGFLGKDSFYGPYTFSIKIWQ